MACTDNTDTVQLDVTGGVLTANVVIDPDPANALDSGASGLFVTAQNETGWFDAGETWIYSGADAPSFAIAILGDKSARYAAGMRMRMKQGGGFLYFIATAVSYDAGSGLTTITMYGGSSYILANATITDNSFSWAKVPAGFPASPTLWTEELDDTADRSQAAPGSSVWYNMGALTLTIPVGAWYVYWQTVTRAIYTASGSIDVRTTLSSGAATESDPQLTAVSEIGTSGNVSTRVTGPFTRQKPLVLGAKAPYYLNARVSGSCTSVVFLGSAYSPSIIRAVCAYL
jgi:hypothetical protein